MKQLSIYNRTKQNNSVAISANNTIWNQNLSIKLILLVLLGFMMTFVAKAQPIISSFSPAKGIVGSSVTITGSNFDATPANNVVYFGATRAAVTAATVSSLTVIVPLGGTYQPITVVNTTTGLIGYSTSTFNIIYNSGNGQYITAASFKARVSFPTTLNPSGIVAVADLDGDGKPDLITVNRLFNTFSVLRNTSTKGTITTTSFAAKVDITTDSTPSSIAIGDLDGDGKPDVVITNQFKNTITIYKNTATSGTISFAAPVSLVTDTLSLPTSVAIADLDGDGKAELIVVNSYRDNISVLKNIGTKGTINSASFSSAVNFTTGQGPTTVVVADIDGDGKPDLAVSNFAAKSVSVLRNTSTGNTITSSSFAAKVDYAVGTGPHSVTAADLNGDGKPELITANQGNNTISILTNTTTSGAIVTGSFATQFILPSNGESPYYVTAANIDGDNMPDLVVANLVNNRLSVIRNNFSSGTLGGASFSAPVSFATGYYPFSVSVADFDGDGKPDLAVPLYGGDSISIYQNALANSLPVKLINFTGNYENPGKTLLQWATASEINTLSFTIERSTNGLDYYAIGTENAKGASDYSFIDDNVTGTSVFYYRLQILDNDGSISYSPIVSIAINGNKDFKVYPNPAKNFINVESNGASNGLIILTDFAGRTILASKLNGNSLQQISLGNVSKGIYSLSIITANGKQSEAIVVQ